MLVFLGTLLSEITFEHLRSTKRSQKSLTGSHSPECPLMRDSSISLRSSTSMLIGSLITWSQASAIAINTPLLLAADETMVPINIRNVCHHMFIRGKPHPNGILATTMADRHLLLLGFRIRRRTRDDYDSEPFRIVKPAVVQS